MISHTYFRWRYNRGDWILLESSPELLQNPEPLQAITSWCPMHGSQIIHVNFSKDNFPSLDYSALPAVFGLLYQTAEKGMATAAQ